MPKSTTGLARGLSVAGNSRGIHPFSILSLVPVPSGISSWFLRRLLAPVALRNAVCHAVCHAVCRAVCPWHSGRALPKHFPSDQHPRHLDLRNNPLSGVLSVDAPRGPSSRILLDGQASPSIRLQRSCPHGPQYLLSSLSTCQPCFGFPVDCE